MIGISGNNLSVINSERDVNCQLSTLNTESDVEGFNNNLVKCMNAVSRLDLDPLVRDVIAQDLQGFSGDEMHIAIKKIFFNTRIKEIFGEEIANNFKFRGTIEYINQKEYIKKIYEQDGYYVFDYDPENSANNGLEYKDKKVENDTIRYEYFYNPKFMVKQYKKMMTLEELMNKDREYFFIEEIPVVSITYTKKNGLYRITSMEGINKIYEVKILLYENYGISI